jgi:periplasmic divalent cation tolerance protein
MGNYSSAAIVVLMTAPNREEAGRIAEMLVDGGLAACVQILPEIESVYRWKGETQHEQEVLLLAKTTRARFDDLASRVNAMHSYETPEIIALPIADAPEAYLKWLVGSLSEGS